MAQFLTTEHFTLQGARSAVVSESAGRAAAYLTTLSAAMIALGFVVQAAGRGEAFLWFAVVLFPVLILIGVFTLVRLTHLSATDVLYTQAINRIRHYYLDAAPEAARYLSLPASDDSESIARARGMYQGFGWRILPSDPSQVAVINSFVVGVFGALLAATVLKLQLPLAIGIGGLTVLVAWIGHILLGKSIIDRTRSQTEYRFPASTEPSKLSGDRVKRD